MVKQSSRPAGKSTTPAVQRAAVKRVVNKGPHQVRIIGGQWKRTPLRVVDAPGLRPTPDRVRETLFNWLHHLFDGLWETRCVLDLFAGSGALGFEAASRGVARVDMVENASTAMRSLQEVKAKLQASQVNLHRADALQWLRNPPAGQFDLVFLDPPYALDLLPTLLPACPALLKPQGLVYAESDHAFPAEGSSWFQDWEIVRQDRAGAVHFCLLHCKKLA